MFDSYGMFVCITLRSLVRIYPPMETTNSSWTLNNLIAWENPNFSVLYSLVRMDCDRSYKRGSLELACLNAATTNWSSAYEPHRALPNWDCCAFGSKLDITFTINITIVHMTTIKKTLYTHRGHQAMRNEHCFQAQNLAFSSPNH